MIRLAIIEDNPVYLEALEIYIEQIPVIELVHVANNLQEVPALINARPDVVLMDIHLGNDSGIEGVKMIKGTLPDTGILMLTVFDDEEKIVQSIKAGASGYLLKKDSPKKILEAIQNVAKGEGAVSGAITKTILNALHNRVPDTVNLDFYQLTKREKEIFQLLLAGLSYKEIATRSFISMATMNTHIRNIYSKLGVHTRAEIAARFGKF